MELGQNEETCLFKYVWKTNQPNKKTPGDPWESKWILRSFFKLSLIYIQQLLGALAVF